LHELKLIVDLLHEGGLANMHKFISETAKYGDLTRGPRIVNAGTKREMKKVLKEIQQGKFARQWINENKKGRKKYNRLMNKDLKHKIEKVGSKLRDRMPWLEEAR
jgi:ketol-acid reductoisomerase